MKPTDSEIKMPDPDDIRRAIDATDERARLLRRLLRLAIRLHLPLTTGDRINPPASPSSAKGGARG